jgi:hypothetical protein
VVRAYFFEDYPIFSFPIVGICKHVSAIATIAWLSYNIKYGYFVNLFCCTYIDFPLYEVTRYLLWCLSIGFENMYTFPQTHVHVVSTYETRIYICNIQDSYFPTWGSWSLCKLIHRGWKGSSKNTTFLQDWERFLFY